MKKIFYLAINKNNNGFSATVEINEFFDRGDRLSVAKIEVAKKSGSLPSADSLLERADKFWKEDYQLAAEHFKISDTEKAHLPIVDDQEIKLNTLKKSRELIQHFCDWLKHDDFLGIAKIIQKQGETSDENGSISLWRGSSFTKLYNKGLKPLVLTKCSKVRCFR